MADLSYREKADLEALFEMGSGYVMDFSNNSFARFMEDIIHLDVYEGIGYTEYASKANKLRQIWLNEPDNVVGTLLDALLNYCEDYKLRNNKLTEYDAKKIADMRLVAKRLKENQLQVELPKREEETLQTLQEDIASALARNKPELALDRLHTYLTKLLRRICDENGIKTVDDKGNHLPLHSLAGMLKKHYEKNPIFQSSFTTIAIQNSISLFERFNAVRNDQSYAHDNPVLDTLEAEFAVKIMSDVITFIDKVERYKRNS